MEMAVIVLKKRRESSLRRKHPWIFSGAIKKIEGSPQSGDTVEIESSDGHKLGKGAFSSHSQIAVRMWTFNPEEDITDNYFRQRLLTAYDRRKNLLESEATDKVACRLVNAESDGLPGLIIDKYGTYLVCQYFGAGMDKWKPVITKLISELFHPSGVYERSDVDIRSKEGLKKQTGTLWGSEPPGEIIIEENGIQFLVDIQRGHKTGFYLDQRENRKEICDFSKNAEVLNCFSYTGGFSLYALKYGAKKVVNIESSQESITIAEKNLVLNGFNPDKMVNIRGDVFQTLRDLNNKGKQFDLIILDPPKFVESRRHLKKGTRGYKDINLSAFRLLRPGGILFTFSCSGLLSPELFQKIVADAALDAGREAQIIKWLHQSSDHPTALNFPEGLYLKGLICSVI